MGSQSHLIHADLAQTTAITTFHAGIIITDGCVVKFMRNWERLSIGTVDSKVSVPSYWIANCIDVPMG